MLCLALREVPSILLGQTCKCYFIYINVIYLSTQAMHNYKISETNHLRVSFSKSPIS